MVWEAMSEVNEKLSGEKGTSQMDELNQGHIKLRCEGKDICI